MPSYYYTYGISPGYPYCGGWTKIDAPDRAYANKIFRTMHPSLPGHGITLNCAFTYDEKDFVKTEMYKNNDNFGSGCLETISFDIDITAKAYSDYLLYDDITLIRKPDLTLDTAIFTAKIDEAAFLRLYSRIPSACDPIKSFDDFNHVIIGFNSSGECAHADIYFNDHSSAEIPIYRVEASSIAKQLVAKVDEWKKSHPDDDINEVDSERIDHILTKYWE